MTAAAGAGAVCRINGRRIETGSSTGGFDMYRGMALALVLSLAAPPAPAGPVVVAEGAWQTIDYEVEGRWQIVRDGDRLRVELDERFETKNGPDLHIVLSERPLDRVTDRNATRQALIVGRLRTNDRSTFLKKMKGAQSLPLPPGTDLSDYRSILIHCVEFSHLWAGAPL